MTRWDEMGPLAQEGGMGIGIQADDGAYRLFGFFFGSTLTGAGIYYYVLDEYKLSNELLTEDIYVSTDPSLPAQSLYAFYAIMLLTRPRETTR